jgi:hypothetical protein
VYKAGLLKDEQRLPTKNHNSFRNVGSEGLTAVLSFRTSIFAYSLRSEDSASQSVRIAWFQLLIFRGKLDALINILVTLTERSETGNESTWRGE